MRESRSPYEPSYWALLPWRCVAVTRSAATSVMAPSTLSPRLCSVKMGFTTGRYTV